MNSSKRAAALALCFLPLFALLAAANSAGYRFGASDQAFYVPAIYRAMDPRLYPRDAELIDSQARLTILDESVAPLARLTGIGLPALFVALQLLLLGLLAFAALRIASHLYRTWWAGVALLAALTLRHALLRTGTNTLE